MQENKPLVWRKSSASNPSGNCVEVADLPGGKKGVRNSRNPNGPVLIFTPDEFAAWVKGCADGEFG